jgi:hypothetical protein
MKNKVVTLKTYESMVDAAIDQDILQQDGIECFIGNRQLVQLYPMFSDIDEGLKIVVFEENYERALALLDEFHSADKQ